MIVSEARRDFVKRLNEACDASDFVPDLQHGRYVRLSQELGVSEEAVRKWFAGITMPGRDTMRRLAAYLKKDELWLAMGRKPDMDRESTARFARDIEGATLLVAGLVQLAGGTCAWPSEDDPRKGVVDFYTIMRGRQYSIRVLLAREVAPSRFEIEAPSDLTMLTLVGVIPGTRRGRYDFIQLPTAQVAQQRNRRTGGYLIPLVRIDDRYTTGKTDWPAIRSFVDLTF